AAPFFGVGSSGLFGDLFGVDNGHSFNAMLLLVRWRTADARHLQRTVRKPGSCQSYVTVQDQNVPPASWVSSCIDDGELSVEAYGCTAFPSKNHCFGFTRRSGNPLAHFVFAGIHVAA